MPVIKENFEFSKKEYMDIIIATLILSFIFSLSSWGGSLNYATQLVFIIIAVFCSLILHIAAQKILGLIQGYESEFKISIISLLIALMIAFLTEGIFTVQIKGFILVLVIPGALVYKAMEKHRIGKWPRGPNFSEMGFISSSGVILNLALAVIFYGLFQLTNLWGFWLVTIINALFAFGTILPIPNNDGLQILYGSRVSYVITAILIVVTSIFILSKFSFLLVLVLTIITALVIWFGYYYFIERKYLGG